MKKILSMVIIFACLLSLCSCGIAGYILEIGSLAIVDNFYRDYEQDPKVFHFEQMSITLTDGFYGESYETMALYSSLNETIVTLEKLELLYLGYENGLSVEEYAELVRLDISHNEFASFVDVTELSEVVSENGIVYFEMYLANSYGVKYLVSVDYSGDSLWLCYFGTYSDKYEEYRPHFLKWAASVEISNANQEV